jgi:hypothetical protein
VKAAVEVRGRGQARPEKPPAAAAELRVRGRHGQDRQHRREHACAPHAHSILSGMNKRVILLAVLGVALAGAYVHGQFPTGPSKLDVVKVRDDLFVIHNAFVPGNSTVLITNEGVILVDDKFPQDVDNILAEIKKLTNQPVRYVVNTHHHGDHSGGNPRLQAMNVDVVASEAARQHFADLRQPGAPTITFDDSAYLTLGGKRVELYRFGRAHTNGDIVAFFPAQRAPSATTCRS